MSEPKSDFNISIKYALNIFRLKPETDIITLRRHIFLMLTLVSFFVIINALYTMVLMLFTSIKADYYFSFIIMIPLAALILYLFGHILAIPLSMLTVKLSANKYTYFNDVHNRKQILKVIYFEYANFITFVLMVIIVIADALFSKTFKPKASTNTYRLVADVFLFLLFAASMLILKSRVNNLISSHNICDASSLIHVNKNTTQDKGGNWGQAGNDAKK